MYFFFKLLSLLYIFHCILSLTFDVSIQKNSCKIILLRLMGLLKSKVIPNCYTEKIIRNVIEFFANFL